MTETIHTFAATEPKGKLLPFTFSLPELGPEELDIEVLYRGLCHSDLSMLNNEWQNTTYPFVPGHEVVGRVVRAGKGVRGLPDALGDLVGKVVGLG